MDECWGRGWKAGGEMLGVVDGKEKLNLIQVEKTGLVLQNSDHIEYSVYQEWTRSGLQEDIAGVVSWVGQWAKVR